MANLKIPNLCGTSLEFNSIQTSFENLITSAIDGLEVDASTLSSTALSDFNSLELEHRNLIPKIPDLPNLNLQSLVTSLSSLTPGSFEHTQLLSNITTDFGTELTAGGYDLDKLVSTALSTIQGGGDLCSAVPNFELPADGLTAAVEKAVESKQPTVDSAEEKTSTLLRNSEVVAQRAGLGVKVQKMIPEPSTEVDVVADTVTEITPPKEDIGAYKVATKTSNVTTTDGVKVETTTPEDSITSTKTITKVDESTSTKTQTTITSGGRVTSRTRANTAESGFTGRPIYMKESIFEDDFKIKSSRSTRATSEGEGLDRFNEYEIELKHVPIKILGIIGWNPSVTGKWKWRVILRGIIVTQASSGRKRWRYLAQVELDEKYGAGKEFIKSRGKDFWSLDGKILSITDKRGNGYGPSKENGPYFKIRYRYADTYDPRFVASI